MCAFRHTDWLMLHDMLSIRYAAYAPEPVIHFVGKLHQGLEFIIWHCLILIWVLFVLSMARKNKFTHMHYMIYTNLNPKYVRARRYEQHLENSFSFDCFGKMSFLSRCPLWSHSRHGGIKTEEGTSRLKHEATSHAHFLTWDHLPQFRFGYAVLSHLKMKPFGRTEKCRQAQTWKVQQDWSLKCPWSMPQAAFGKQFQFRLSWQDGDSVSLASRFTSECLQNRGMSPPLTLYLHGSKPPHIGEMVE